MPPDTLTHTERCAGVIRETVRFRGARGELAGELAYPWGAAGFAGLLLNPHPFMGGSVANRLVETLALGLAEAGGVTLRFDYGGVGSSGGPPVNVVASLAQFWQTGAAPEDPELVDDARGALHWLKRQTGLLLVAIGYSFGAYSAACIADEHVDALVLISPTVGKHDFTSAACMNIPRLVLYGDDDFATPEALMQSWLSTVRGPCQSHRVCAGQHFFRGQETEIVGMCLRFLHQILPAPSDAVPAERTA